MLDALASRWSALLPEEEREDFALTAIAKALEQRQQEAEGRFAASLLAEFDPEQEPEREAAECIAAVEEELAGIDIGRNEVSLEEVRRQWEAEKAARAAGRK